MKAALGHRTRRPVAARVDGKTYQHNRSERRGRLQAADGSQNQLRRWGKNERRAPRTCSRSGSTRFSGLTERLWSTAPTDLFAAPTADDLTRESTVESIVENNLARWQAEGVVPDMEIEPGDKTDEPIRTRGGPIGTTCSTHGSCSTPSFRSMRRRIAYLKAPDDQRARMTRWSTGDGDG